MRACLLFLAMIILPTATAAAGFETSQPEAVGLSSEKLSVIDQELNADIEAGAISGATVSILRRGKRVYHKAFGTRGNGDSAGPLKTDDIFRIYSMTKPITSVAVLMLLEQGKLKLEDPVSNYIPAFSETQVMAAGKQVPAQTPITIADLLRHTSGIVYGFFGDTEARTEYKKVDLYGVTQSTEEMVLKLAALPLEHQPGTHWEYSRSTDVLGRVIEVVSGRRLDAFFEQEILQPLNMKDTGFYVPENKKPRIVEPNFPGLSNPLIKPNLLSGGGGLHSTADDYLTFTNMILRGGIHEDKRLLKAETVAMMTQNQLGGIRPGNYDLLGPENGFGFGFSVRLSDEGRAPGSKGDYWWGGYAGTYFWIDPKEELIVVFMMQQPDKRSAMRPRLRQWIYGAMTK